MTGRTAEIAKPNSEDRGLSPDAFVSYSRRPEETTFVTWLAEKLDARGKLLWIDQSEIEPGTAWRERINRGIRRSRAYIFVISPASAASSECRNEVELAVEENKKILPIIFQSVPDAVLPEEVLRHHWLDFTAVDDRENALDALVAALETDIEWRDLHTRLLDRARDWNDSGRNRAFLLRGRDLRSAEDWYGQKEEHAEQPTSDQYEFISSSRRNANRRLRYLAIGVACALVVSLAATTTAVIQRQNAIAQSHQAQSEEMAAEANGLFASNSPVAMTLGIQGYERYPTQQARNALTQSAHIPIQGVSADPAAVETSAFDPSGTLYATGDRDGHVVLHSFATHKRREWNTGGPVATLTFSPDGSTMATSGFAGTVVLWNVSTGVRLASWMTPGSVWGVAYSPSGHLLAMAGDDGKIGLWNLETGTKTLWHEADTVVGSPTFSPDGHTFATLDAQGNVILWSVSTQNQISNWNVGSTGVVRFSPDGRTLAVGNGEGQVVLIDVVTGNKTVFSDGSSINGIAFSPNGKTLVTGDDSGLVALWDLATGTRSAWNAGSGVETVAYSPDGHSIVSGESNDQVIQWDGVSMRSAGSATFAAFDPDGGQLAIGDVRGRVSLWNASGDATETWQEGSTVEGMSFSPDGRILATTNGFHEVVLIDVKSGKETTWTSSNEQTAPEFSPNEQSLSTLNDSGDLVQWNVSEGTSRTAASFGSYNSWATSPDGRLLGLVTDSGELIVWNVATDHSVAQWRVGSKVSLQAISRNDRLVAVSNAGNQVTLWQIATHHEQPFTWSDGSQVVNASFGQDDRYLAVADTNGQVTVLNTSNSAKSSWYDGAAVYGITFDPNGARLATGDANGLVTMSPTTDWTGDFAPLKGTLCKELSGFNMTASQWSAYVPNQSFQQTCRE